MAFGFEANKINNKSINVDGLIDVAVIASFKPDGQLRPLKIKFKNEQEGYITYEIDRILYASYEDLLINFGIILKLHRKINVELIYIIEPHQWKMKYLN